ncbi:MAG: ATP-grasp domain-containing protein [Bacteroidia bacterium]
MEFIAFTEAYSRPLENASHVALRKATEGATLAGWRVVGIPDDFEGIDAARDAIAHLPDFTEGAVGAWIGFVPGPEKYALFYQAAAEKGIRLLNGPTQYQFAQEFHRYYPLINEFTALSEVVDSAEALERISVPYPIFVRGSVQSKKYLGLNACLANNLDELRTLVTALLANHERSRDHVILRQYRPLRHVQMHQGFPQGREFRAFVLDGKVLAMGYYWQQADPLQHLDSLEEAVVRSLAEKVARLVPSRWIALDIGQAETGEWWVIELGDAQFSGTATLTQFQVFSQLRQTLLPS